MNLCHTHFSGIIFIFCYNLATLIVLLLQLTVNPKHIGANGSRCC